MFRMDITRTTWTFAAAVLAAALLAPASVRAQTTINWAVNGSDFWNKKQSWLGFNVPDAVGEQARHAAVGLNPSTITYDVPQPARQTIHSYRAVPSAAATPRRELLMPGGYTLNLINDLVCEGAGTRYYYVTLQTAANLSVGTDVSDGFTVIVGQPGADNTGTALTVGGDVGGGAWTIHKGASVGTSAAPIGDVVGGTWTFGSPWPAPNTGGRIYVAGDVTGGTWSLYGDDSGPGTNLPVPILDFRGAINGGTWNISGATYSCQDATLRPHFLFQEINYADVTPFELDIYPYAGATVRGGTWVFDDAIVRGTIETIYGGHWVLHHVHEYPQWNMPAPGIRVGRFVADGSDRTDVDSIAGWLVLGPGSSEIGVAYIENGGPGVCGDAPAKLDAHDDGLDLTIHEMTTNFGEFNNPPGAGTDATAIAVLERWTVGTWEPTYMNAGVVTLGRDLELSAPAGAGGAASVELNVRSALDIVSDVAYPNPWNARGVALTVGRPDEVESSADVEAINTDWGAHWFCDVAPGGGAATLDPRVRALHSLIVQPAATARIVDNHSFAGGFPNDAHGAAPPVFANEALFVDGPVTVASHATLDLNGRNVYATGTITVIGSVLNGAIAPLIVRPFGTFDGDSDVDNADYAIILAAYSGAGVPTNNPLCDWDLDGDVDDDDVIAFRLNWTGPGVPAVCN